MEAEGAENYRHLGGNARSKCPVARSLSGSTERPFRKKKRGPFSAVIAVTFSAAERVGRVSLARLDDDDDERDDCLSPPQGKMPNLLNTLESWGEIRQNTSVSDVE